MSRVYHWRHGWIPLDHAAAIAKAHGDPELAKKYELARPKRPKRPTAAHVVEYRTARQAQNARFEAHVGGGISAEDTRTPEYRDYFGVGDHRAGMKQEDRITYREHLRQLGASKAEDKAHERDYRAGVKLGRKHSRGKLSTDAENAEFDAGAGRAEHRDDFEQGYGDGLIAGYERIDQARGDVHPLIGAA